MEYTQIGQEDKDDFNKILQNRRKILYINDERAKVEVSLFMYYYLGLKPFLYQHRIFRVLEAGHKRIAVCSSRQIGKSIAVAVIALQQAFMNATPSGIAKNTKIGIVSKTDEQAKKLMKEIRYLIRMGDAHLKSKTGMEKMMSSKISSEDRNNMTEISFDNRCFIKSFPPTDKIRGESLDIVIVDEAVFVDDEIFNTAIKPTVTATDGAIILTSTPKGNSGFFFELFDPEEKQTEHEYYRLWFPWTVVEGEAQRNFVEKEQKFAEQSGNIKYFDQEYNALFTADESRFFDYKHVEEGIDPNLTLQTSWNKSETVLGLDYGISICHTVVSISTKIDEKVILLYQYSYPLNSDDDSLFYDVKELIKRFNVGTVVVDDCIQGHTNNQRFKNEGYKVELFNFRSDQSAGERNRGYFMFRNSLAMGRIKYPNIPELIDEMKAIVEEQKQVVVSIHKPKGGFDDRIDSFMMSTLPYIREEVNEFGIDLIDSSDPASMYNLEQGSLREDMEWKQFSHRYGGK